MTCTYESEGAADLIGARLDVSPRRAGGTAVACLLSRAQLREAGEEG